jgi:branched-chain amino acid aminotransferase
MGAVVRRIAATGSERIEEIPGAPDGRFADLGDAAQIEHDGGVYAAFATRNGRRVIRLSSHFRRLQDSGQRVGLALRLDPALIGNEICSILESARFPEARIRISAHPEDIDTLIVAAEPFEGLDPRLRERGVACRTAPGAHRRQPRAKQTGWLHERASLSGDPGDDVYEHLLLDDDGRILEGTTSNFYAIEDTGKRPTLWTANEGVLEGIARSIVLEVAANEVAVELVPIARDRLAAVSEAFLTSASRGIVPIVRIDDAPVGDGVPGPWTRRLIGRYEARARTLEEPLCTK